MLSIVIEFANMLLASVLVGSIIGFGSFQRDGAGCRVVYPAAGPSRLQTERERGLTFMQTG